jgi:hypothetical protein
MGKDQKILPKGYPRYSLVASEFCIEVCSEPMLNQPSAEILYNFSTNVD